MVGSASRISRSGEGYGPCPRNASTADKFRPPPGLNSRCFAFPPMRARLDKANTTVQARRPHGREGSGSVLPDVYRNFAQWLTPTPFAPAQRQHGTVTPASPSGGESAGSNPAGGTGAEELPVRRMRGTESLSCLLRGAIPGDPTVWRGLRCRPSDVVVAGASERAGYRVVVAVADPIVVGVDGADDEHTQICRRRCVGLSCVRLHDCSALSMAAGRNRRIGRPSRSRSCRPSAMR